MNKILFIMMMCAATLSANETEAQKKEVRVENVKKVMANAKNQWPDNFTMQKIYINAQVNALQEIEIMNEYLNSSN